MPSTKTCDDCAKLHIGPYNVCPECWTPLIVTHALDYRVLVVAKTRVEGAWKAYVGAVPGKNHRQEQTEVLRHGATVNEKLARIMFPQFNDLEYAR